MRYEELRLEVGDEVVAVPFHERLTVIAGVGAPEREGLVAELLGALSSHRGITLRFVDDDGRRLELVRPTEGDERVVDVETGEDVTDELAATDGGVDLLAAAGLTIGAATSRMRLSARDVAAASQSEELVTTLARVDQGRLWRAAEALRDANIALKEEASAAGTVLEDAAVVDQIERHHHAVEQAVLRQEQLRNRGMQVAGIAGVGAVAASLHHPLLAIPFVAVSVAILVMKVRIGKQIEHLRAAEEAALDAAGARSYLGFHVRRVEGMIESGETRERLAHAADLHRIAKREWTSVAGDVEVEWALDRRDRIEEAAAGDHADQSVEPSDLAHAIVARLGDLRGGIGGRVFPLLLDEPFGGAEASIKHWLLELIGTSAGNPQIVYLTEDEEVAAWARLEALTGALAIIEPAHDRDGETDDEADVSAEASVA